MHTLHQSTQGLGLVFLLNWDRLVNIVVLVIALLAGAYVGSLI